MVGKFSSYGSVGIGLLNLTTGEDIESFLKLFFIKRDKNFFQCEIVKLPERQQKRQN